MPDGAIPWNRLAPNVRAPSAVDALLTFACHRDAPFVALPRAEAQIVARYGVSARDGLDVHVLGGGQTARRKLIRRGQRAVTARLRLGTQETVLGVPARALAGQIVSLDALWGDALATELEERLHEARDPEHAAKVLEGAISARVATRRRRPRSLALEAADRLAHAPVNAVADALGVSERHLRRGFLEAVGLSPKTFAKLSRFHRALALAQQKTRMSWASIASAAGYYDQAHLIAEFRAIAGATPQSLLTELGGEPRLD